MYLTVNQPVQVADTFNFMQKKLEAFTSEENFPDTPITMASATLTLGDRAELFEFLHIHASRCRIISGSLDRPNLFYSVEPVHTFNLRQKLDPVALRLSRSIILRHVCSTTMNTAQSTPDTWVRYRSTAWLG